jgi:imidazolonepropionase-like amidohydrolase
MLSQAMTVDEALRSLTIDAAFAQGSNDTVGSIEEGKAADLVILSTDPTEMAPEALWDIEVIATLVDGEVEYCRKSIPSGLRKLCPKG